MISCHPSQPILRISQQYWRCTSGIPLHSGCLNSVFLLTFSCDLNSVAFASNAGGPVSVLEGAPDGWISRAQDEYLSHALRILKLCCTILTKLPAFLCQDPTLAPCFYRAIHACLWDLFRHPAPSPSMKRFVVHTCKSAVIICQGMGVFPFARAVVSTQLYAVRQSNAQLRDLSVLFQQCELLDMLCSECVTALFAL